MTLLSPPPPLSPIPFLLPGESSHFLLFLFFLFLKLNIHGPVECLIDSLWGINSQEDSSQNQDLGSKGRLLALSSGPPVVNMPL